MTIYWWYIRYIWYIINISSIYRQYSCIISNISSNFEYIRYIWYICHIVNVWRYIFNVEWRYIWYIRYIGYIINISSIYHQYIVSIVVLYQIYHQTLNISVEIGRNCNLFMKMTLILSSLVLLHINAHYISQLPCSVIVTLGWSTKCYKHTMIW